MIIRQIVVVGDQSIRIRKCLDRFSKRIGNFQSDIGISGNQCAVINDKGLSLFIVDQPVQEILGSLTLCICDILRRVDKEVFGSAAYKLLVV